MANSLRFYGAVRNVTGSKHLLEWEGERVLLDCGMLQGSRRSADAGNRKLPFDPSSIDHVILSHAHIDHSGSLPVLVRDGYRGKVWCTPATADLTEILLADSAYIQEADARYLNKKRRPNDKLVHPVYLAQDSEAVSPRLARVPYRQRTALSERISFKLIDAGHILGSAMVVLYLRTGARTVTVGFTGDHGRKGMPILRDPARMPSVDYLITESTYGDRLHLEHRPIEDELKQLVEAENRDGGRLLIPAFAVGRTQNLIFALGRLRARHEIPRLPIFVDSPLAQRATSVAANHPEVFDGQARRMLERGQDPFYFDGIRYTQDVAESKALNDFDQPCIIISASGMMESGRILHHLRRSISHEEDCVLIVGYQAQHTLGRRLLRGEKSVKIFGEEFRVRCNVCVMNGLSAHADYSELLESLRHLAGRVKRTFLVHGDENAAFALRDRLAEVGFGDLVVPVEGDSYEIGPVRDHA